MYPFKVNIFTKLYTKNNNFGYFAVIQKTFIVEIFKLVYVTMFNIFIGNTNLYTFAFYGISILTYYNYYNL